MLLARLTSYSDEFECLAEEQCGFRSGRGTLDQIFTLHEILASRRERKKHTFRAFLDARHAYDRVWRDGLLYRLVECGVNGRMLRFVSSMLSATNRHVAAHGAQSAEFTTTVGLPQGAVLSPLLYAIFINALVDDLKSRGLGVNVFGRKVGILLYADDIVLIAESAEQLQQMLDCTSEYATRWQFRFNTKAGKSDVVVMPLAAAGDHQFRMGDGVLNISQEYKYLGVEMGRTGQGCWTNYLERAERKAMAAMQALTYSVVAGSKPLWVSTATHLFKTLVRPILEYGGAIYGPMCSEAALATLERVQVRFGRRVLHLQQAIPGEYIRRELGLESMKERVLVASLRFFDHLASMPDERLAGHVFRGRCGEVDDNVWTKDGRGDLSWCLPMKKTLVKLGHRSFWNSLTAPKKWTAMTKQLAKAECKAIGDARMAPRENMQLFGRLGAPSVKGWLNLTVDHPGAALRFKLRCSGAPLMAVVGGNHRLPMQERTCRMCKEQCVEDAEHFVSKCGFYDDERRECLRRLNVAITGEYSPVFRQAMEDNDVNLFLGDKMLLNLPEQKRGRVDRILCDFLKVAWRKRDTVWAPLTERKGWRLK
jgi:reverse transcriptase-like protein